MDHKRQSRETTSHQVFQRTIRIGTTSGAFSAKNGAVARHTLRATESEAKARSTR